MEWFKKNPFWGSVGIGVLIATIGGVVFWQWAARRAASIEEEIRDTRAQVLRLKKRGVFPSPENVALFNQINERLKQYLEPAEARMRQGQVPAQQIDPYEFKRQLRQTINALMAKASRGAGQVTKLPDGFTFGFSQYVAAAIPQPDTVPQLMQQVEIVRQIVEMLYEANAEEITSIRRWPVEYRPPTPAPAAGAKPGTPAPPAPPPPVAAPDLLPAVDVNRDWRACRAVPFEFTFVCDTDRLRRFMNRLLDPSITRPYFLVRGVRVLNLREAPPTLDDLKNLTAAAVASGQSLGVNFILGTERISVTMRIDYEELKAAQEVAIAPAPGKTAGQPAGKGGRK